MPAPGGAEAEWQRLSILLKLMDKTVGVWGSPDAMYGQTPLAPQNAAVSKQFQLFFSSSTSLCFAVFARGGVASFYDENG